MDRTQASYELPMLNRGIPYVPDAGRTVEDDVPLIYDAVSTLHRRTHVLPDEFEYIYRDTMRFFTEQERHFFKSLQSGDRKPEEFYKQCAEYLRRNHKSMMNKNDFDVMMERIDLAIFGYDIIQPLIDNKDTTDIKICSPYDIRVRVKGKAYKSNATFIDDRDLYRFIDGLAIRNRVNILAHPVLTFTDKHDENYILRFTVSSPMVNSVDYPYLHIRKVPKTKPFFDDLIKAGMMNEDVKLYLIDRAKASRGIVFAGPPGCVDKDTEFFNGKGWKKISDYEKGDKVLQFNTSTNVATLVEPIKYIKEPCNKMYRFKTKYGIDQMLSSEHRVIYYYKTHKNGKKIWNTEPKEMSCEELYVLQNNGKFHGGFKTTFEYSGSGFNLSDIEIKLMLAVICDGDLDNRKDYYKKCRINLKKQRKKDALEKILNEWGEQYTKNDLDNGYTVYYFDAPLKEKTFSHNWYKCSKKQLELICENILQWDGSVDKKGRMFFESTKKETIDFIQFAFSACGYRVTIKEDDRVGQSYMISGKDYIRKSISYTLYISKNTIVGMDWHNDGRKNNTLLEEVVPTDGYKYCFCVPTHALVLRRNGKIFITGNSGKSTALNAYIEHIPKTRETLVIQENDELHTEQSGFMFKHVTHGFQGEPVCTLEDLGKMALVEGCNQFIIGEVKGGEMRYAMTLINAGGYAALTVHSTNAYETMDKLADLVKYGSSYSFDEARRMLKTFDTVVYMEGFKIREILEVGDYNDKTHNFEYINIYRYFPPGEEPILTEAGEGIFEKEGEDLSS